MKNFKLSSYFLLFAVIATTACNEETEQIIDNKKEVPITIVNDLKSLGFNTGFAGGVRSFSDGYLVEGDIFVTRASLKGMIGTKHFAIANAPNAEQYRTFNLVQGLPRTIDVWVDPVFSNSYAESTNEAIARYNAENLTLTFRRVTDQNNADYLY